MSYLLTNMSDTLTLRLFKIDIDCTNIHESGHKNMNLQRMRRRMNPQHSCLETIKLMLQQTIRKQVALYCRYLYSPCSCFGGHFSVLGMKWASSLLLTCLALAPFHFGTLAAAEGRYLPAQ